MKQVKTRKNFTLVELLVSLGVFSILLIVFMQFFSGMRLVWTNAEKNSTAHTDVRVAMDYLSVLLGSLYYSTANTPNAEKGFFLFSVKANGNNPDEIYFATKTQIDLAGSNPVRFIGVLVPSSDNHLGAGSALHDKLYLTVLSNKEGSNNAEVYRQLFPQFVGSDDNETILLSDALTLLTTNLQNKLKDNTTPAVDTPNRIKLLDNVVDFKVRLLKGDGSEESGGVITSATREIEISISVLTDDDYRQWSTSANKDEFRALRQTTFTRRIYIGDRSLLEDQYE